MATALSNLALDMVEDGGEGERGAADARQATRWGRQRRADNDQQLRPRPRGHAPLNRDGHRGRLIVLDRASETLRWLADLRTIARAGGPAARARPCELWVSACPQRHLCHRSRPRPRPLHKRPMILARPALCARAPRAPTAVLPLELPLRDVTRAGLDPVRGPGRHTARSTCGRLTEAPPRLSVLCAKSARNWEARCHSARRNTRTVGEKPEHLRVLTHHASSAHPESSRRRPPSQ